MRTLGLISAAIATISIASCSAILGLDDYRLACPNPDVDTTCAPCDEASECGPEEPCRSWNCDWGSCIPMDAPARTPCGRGVCSGEEHSRCVECAVDADCGEGAYCFNFQCARCDDGIDNGDELEPDCGGHCRGCLGHPCTSAEQCVSGFCADGSCCDSPCTDICTRCEFTGECVYVAQFHDDSEPFCDGQMSCNGGGLCALNPHQLCTSSAQCASTVCGEDGRCTGP